MALTKVSTLRNFLKNEVNETSEILDCPFKSTCEMLTYSQSCKMFRQHRKQFSAVSRHNDQFVMESNHTDKKLITGVFENADK